jgi:hypothetical protein
MRRWVFWFACVLVLGSSSASFGQEPSGPRTLENLLKSDDAKQSGAPAAADGTDSGPKRPEGTVSRPKDGVQHPDLDTAWAEYAATVSKANESVKAAIAKQFDAATAKGDLDAAEKWQTIGEKFEKAGELPAEKETKAAVGSAVVAYKKARDELGEAYDAVAKALTVEKNITAARAAKDESQGLAEKIDELRESTSQTDRRKGSVAAAREFSVTIHLTSDWGSVTLHPASAVALIKQEVVKGGQQWKVSDNKVELHGQPFTPNGSTVKVMCRLKGPTKELILETHKGDIGALYVETASRGEVLGQFTNEGNHGGNWRQTDSCRQEFKVVVP